MPKKNTVTQMQHSNKFCKENQTMFIIDCSRQLCSYRTTRYEFCNGKSFAPCNENVFGMLRMNVNST